MDRYLSKYFLAHYLELIVWLVLKSLNEGC